MDFVAPQFGLVRLTEIAQTDATVALIPQLTLPLPPLSLSCQYVPVYLPCHVNTSVCG